MKMFIQTYRGKISQAKGLTMIMSKLGEDYINWSLVLLLPLLIIRSKMWKELMMSKKPTMIKR